jgi:hypothetical protein
MCQDVPGCAPLTRDLEPSAKFLGRHPRPPSGSIVRASSRNGRTPGTRLPVPLRLRLGCVVSDMWTTPEKDPRTYGNPVGEMATYREYLGYCRLTIELKSRGSTPTSSPGARCRPAR